MKKQQNRAFLILEIVFAILIVGVAFGIFSRFYASKNEKTISIDGIENAQEKAFEALKQHINPAQTRIYTENGAFCEGQLFETNQNGSVFKVFEPAYCDNP